MYGFRLVRPDGFDPQSTKFEYRNFEFLLISAPENKKTNGLLFGTNFWGTTRSHRIRCDAPYQKAPILEIGA